MQLLTWRVCTQGDISPCNKSLGVSHVKTRGLDSDYTDEHDGIHIQIRDKHEGEGIYLY